MINIFRINIKDYHNDVGKESENFILRKYFSANFEIRGGGRAQRIGVQRIELYIISSSKL
jgi:hypothetical protein